MKEEKLELDIKDGYETLVREASPIRNAQQKHHATFVTFWHGVKLSTLEWGCIKSFIDRGHEYHLYAYSDVMLNCHVPPGTLVRPAEEILPREQLFYFEESP